MSRYQSLLVILCQVIFLSKISCGPVEHSIELSADKIERIKQTAAVLNRTLSPEIDPCDDFRGYVCKKFKKVHLDHREQEQLKIKILADYLLESDLSEAEQKFKKYLKSCEQGDDWKQFAREFKLESIKGWPAFDPDWKADQMDLQSAMAELQTYMLFGIIRQHFDTKREIPGNVYLSVSVDPFTLFTYPGRTEGIKQSLVDAGVQNVDEVMKDATQVEEDCKKLLEAHFSTELVRTETDFKGLKKEIPEIDWDKQIEILTGHPLKDNFPVVVTNIAAVRSIFVAVSKMNPKIVANYLFCNFIESIPTAVHGKERCYLNIFGYFENLMIMKGLFGGDGQVNPKDMAQYALKYINKFLPVFDGLKADDIPATESVLDESYFSIFSADNLNKQLQQIDIDDNKFFRNTFLLNRWNVRFSYENIDSLRKVRFLVDGIPLTVLREIKNEPSAIVYNNIAMNLASQYLQTVLTPWQFPTPLLNCLKPQLSPLEIDYELPIAVAVYQMIAKGYREWADQNQDIVHAENEILKEYALTNEKVLQTWFMQDGCERHREGEITPAAAFTMNSHEFGDAFNCPAGSTMNPKEKCNVDNFV